jgi:hypothetical protein
MNYTETIRQQAEQYLDQLSPEKLKVAIDFLAYLAERESNQATEELLENPDFLLAFEQGKKEAAEGNLTDWREIRNDV